MNCHTARSEGLRNRFLFGEKGRKRKIGRSRRRWRRQKRGILYTGLITLKTGAGGALSNTIMHF